MWQKLRKNAKFNPKALALKLLLLTVLIIIYILILKFITSLYGVELQPEPVTVFSGLFFALLVNHIYDFITTRSLHARMQKRVNRLEHRVNTIERVLKDRNNE